MLRLIHCDPVCSTNFRCPRWATLWMGRCPVCLGMLASAPYSSSNEMTSGFPEADASNSIDAWSWAWDSTSAPEHNTINTHSSTATEKTLKCIAFKSLQNTDNGKNTKYQIITRFHHGISYNHWNTTTFLLIFLISLSLYFSILIFCNFFKFFSVWNILNNDIKIYKT